MRVPLSWLRDYVDIQLAPEQLAERLTLLGMEVKGLEQFAKAMYGHDKRTRFRPGYYPFTEPSVAFDVECLVCGGSGCPACSRTGWMTILGAGMVHPVVLQYGGLDPERYQGFAFGMGVERIANLRHSVGDLRLYMENDLRVLDQFVKAG